MTVRAEDLARLREGSTLADVQALLGADARPVTEQSGSRTLEVIRLPGQGVKIFFKGDTVDTVAFEAPFPGAVRGVRIGATQAEVERMLGRPERGWTISDGIDRWLYDHPDFIRVDFDPETDTVRTIFR